MENQITSTTYVPLQPPYQIIKYSGDVAMQIGTLIVTIQKEGNANGLGYSIETHSHPVVAYENKINMDKSRQLSAHVLLEGAVWNYVEVKDVTTVCMNDSRLTWDEFMDFLAYDVERRFCVGQPTVAMYWRLQDLCLGVEPPLMIEHIVHLETRQPLRDDGVTVVRSRAGSVLCLNAPADNEDEMWRIITNELQNYMYIIRNRQRPNKSFHITFQTDEERFRTLVDRLNSMREYTYMLDPF